MKRNTTLISTALIIVAAGAAAGQPWRRSRTAPTTRPAEAAATQPAVNPGIGFQRGQRPGWGRGGGGGPGAADMTAIHSLVAAHDRITRKVDQVPGGVVTLTTSDDPNVTQLLRTHVAQMKRRMADGRPIRMWDPLFAQLFAHRDKVTLQAEDVPGGVKVLATSDDPQVTLLIRQHAVAGVSEFVRDGWQRVPHPTTLPAGYATTK